jgi:hypothetical protein
MPNATNVSVPWCVELNQHVLAARHCVLQRLRRHDLHRPCVVLGLLLALDCTLNLASLEVLNELHHLLGIELAGVVLGVLGGVVNKDDRELVRLGTEEAHRAVILLRVHVQHLQPRAHVSRHE